MGAGDFDLFERYRRTRENGGAAFVDKAHLAPRARHRRIGRLPQLFRREQPREQEVLRGKARREKQHGGGKRFEPEFTRLQTFHVSKKAVRKQPRSIADCGRHSGAGGRLRLRG